MGKRQNMGHRISPPETGIKSLTGREWCLYHNFDFEKFFEEKETHLRKGDKYYDLDNATGILKTKE